MVSRTRRELGQSLNYTWSGRVFVWKRLADFHDFESLGILYDQLISN